MSGRSTSAETQPDDKKSDPVLQDVEPGSDADERPVAELANPCRIQTPVAQRFEADCRQNAGSNKMSQRQSHTPRCPLSKILLALLLASALCHPSLAQSPSPALPAVTAQDNHSLTEAQPPEQSGQAQQMMKEARAELERAALTLQGSPMTPAAQVAAREALVQFEQSLDQLHQSVPGYVPLELATSLQEQVTETLGLVVADASAAAISMLELALRVTDLTAEADLLIGRALIGSGGAKLGNISNVLITKDGRIEAIVIDRMAPSQDQQFVVSWKDVSVKGIDFLSELTAAETDRLPGYPAE